MSQEADVLGQAKRIEQAEERTAEANTRTKEANLRADQAHTETDQANSRTKLAEESENSLRASELSYRRLFEAARDGILILDFDTGRISDANPYLVELLGFSHGEMVGKTVGELSPFKDIVSNRAMLKQLRKVGYVRYENLPLQTKNGHHIAVEFVSNVYQAGVIKVIQCNIRDITVRKEFEERLHLLSTCFAHLNDIVLVTEAGPVEEPGPKIVFVNAAFERLTGYTSAEAVGRNPRFLQGEKTDRRVLAEIREALCQQQSIRRRIISYGKDGSHYLLEMDIVPVFNPTGKCTHFAAVMRDITASNLAENNLRSNEENMALAQRISHFGSWEMSLTNIGDVDANVLRWSDEMFRIAGFEPGTVEVNNDLFFSLIPANEHELIRQELGAAIRERRPYTIVHRIVRPDGKELLIQEVAQIFFDEKSGLPLKMIGTAHDITDQKRTEARFRRLVDSNAQGVFFWNTKGRISGGNDAFLRLVRQSREDLEAGLIDWVAMTPPEYAHLDRRALEQLNATGVCEPYEKEYILKDGSRVPILLGAAMFEDDVTEGVCFILDLSERKKIEQQFLRAQRMESIGTLAGGVAHDLNNILAPILMSIEILKTISTDPDAKSILETIELSATRGADIVRQVLSFARGMQSERIEVQPRHLLRDLENIIRDTFPKNIRLQFRISNDTRTILADPTQMHQILLNLSVNARDAMPHGGSLTVLAENCLLDEHYAVMNPECKAGRYVMISVTDSGTGIPADIVHKIFDPFFTTKELGKGTGLGLSTVMAIVKSHDGIVNVYSEPNKGTTFTVYLPALEGSLETQKLITAPLSLPRGNGEMILVVDDEASIRTITSQTLNSFGYRAITATDGADALGVYVQHRTEIAVVLTDMMMPVMDGQAMIHALTRINPVIKIIATSGLNANGEVGRMSGVGLKHFLMKPYTAETLLKALRSILQEN